MSLTGTDRRRSLEEQVRTVLDSAADGAVNRTTETQSVDFKEEAGRRNGPEIEPGLPENPPGRHGPGECGRLHGELSRRRRTHCRRGGPLRTRHRHRT